MALHCSHLREDLDGWYVLDQACGVRLAGRQKRCLSCPLGDLDFANELLAIALYAASVLTSTETTNQVILLLGGLINLITTPI